MYFASVVLFMLVLPVACIWAEMAVSPHSGGLLLLTGKWFVFWAVGVRLFVAGVRQVVQPRFTAEEIFGIRDTGVLPIVREVGFANLSMGVLGMWSLARPSWVVPAAIVGGLYYGLAGAMHVFQRDKNAKEWTALISDEFMFGVLMVFVVRSWG